MVVERLTMKSCFMRHYVDNKLKYDSTPWWKFKLRAI